jgi:uncharacterized protein YuzE
MRFTYDERADVAYVYLTQAIEPVRDTFECEGPEDARGTVLLDWNDGRLVGLEVLTARILHSDFLSKAVPMRITYDGRADSAYVYLTEEAVESGRDAIECEGPKDARGTVILDWKDGRLVGLEVLTASQVLHSDLLSRAVPLESIGHDQDHRYQARGS